MSVDVYGFDTSYKDVLNKIKQQELAGGKALDINVLNYLLGGLLMGGAGYATTRAFKDVADSLQVKDENEDNSELKLLLPREVFNPEKTAQEKPQDVSRLALTIEKLLPYAAGMVGLGGGYLGTSALYEHLQNYKHNEALKSEQKEYVNLLKQIKEKIRKEEEGDVIDLTPDDYEKVASQKTPLLDKLFEKIAEAMPHDNLYNFVEAVKHVKDNTPTGNYFKSVAKNVIKAEPEMSSDLLAMLGVLALTTGGLTYATGKYYDSVNDEKQRKDKPPQNVALELV